jgi:hypothetical protein
VRVRATLLASALTAAFISPLPISEAAPALPEGVYAATASGVGTVAFADNDATGGAFYLSNASAPFAEATVQEGPAAEAVGSYAYDRNAATGLYSVVSSGIQDGGGPPLPEIPNTAAARYPGHQRSQAGTSSAVPAGPLSVRGTSADAKADPEAASSTAETATSEAEGFSVAGQHATALARAGADAVRSDGFSEVQGIELAGGMIRIGSVVGESHAIISGGRPVARTEFRITDATVADIPVEIGSDGAHVDDQVVPPTVATEVNETVAQILAASGITMRVIAPVSSNKDGASASTPGLEIRIEQSPGGGAPGTALALTIGSTSAAASLAAVLPLPPPAAAGPAPPVAPSGVTGPPTGVSPSVVPPHGAQAVRAFATRKLPPLVGLFALWQISTAGWLAIAWWRRSRSAGT